MNASSARFQGLRTVIYHVSDLNKAKEWYSQVFGIEPYFDEPFYVGFNVGGYELGLDPNIDIVPPGAAGTVAYWGVAEARSTYAQLIEGGAVAKEAPADVGEGIIVASVQDPFGNVIGIIENPHFSLDT